MAYGEVALPTRVGRIVLGEALSESEGQPESAESASQVALGSQDVAYFLLANGEVALPTRVGRIGLGEALERIPCGHDQVLAGGKNDIVFHSLEEAELKVVSESVNLFVSEALCTKP